MNWKKVLKENPAAGMLKPSYIKGKGSHLELIKKLEKLIKEWKPEGEEGKKYLDDLIDVVSNSCPAGTEWCDECKQCETPEEKEEIHSQGNSDEKLLFLLPDE